MRAKSHVWLAVPKAGYVTCIHLFPHKIASMEHTEVETQLKLKCSALTIGQYCADWFIFEWLLSGTMVGIVYSKSKVLNLQDDDVISNQVLPEVLEECFESWFDQHALNVTMKEGTENKVPTIAKLAKYAFCCIYLMLDFCNPINTHVWVNLLREYHCDSTRCSIRQPASCHHVPQDQDKGQTKYYSRC